MYFPLTTIILLYFSGDYYTSIDPYGFGWTIILYAIFWLIGLIIYSIADTSINRKMIVAFSSFIILISYPKVFGNIHHSNRIAYLDKYLDTQKEIMAYAAENIIKGEWSYGEANKFLTNHRGRSKKDLGLYQCKNYTGKAIFFGFCDPLKFNSDFEQCRGLAYAPIQLKVERPRQVCVGYTTSWERIDENWIEWTACKWNPIDGIWEIEN
ncbi:hypothetical protein [Adhaeribacter pallidiroseus]|nr:hypothetical protein [Adhaeribacter pallidiroseus]